MKDRRFFVIYHRHLIKHLENYLPALVSRQITKEEAMHHKLRAKQLESSRGAFEQEPGTMPSAIPAKEVLDMKEKVFAFC